MDDEIDEVARSMTAASPSAALRSGVRARIAGRAGGRRAVRWSLGIAAAAAVIVLTIVWPDREVPVDTPPSRETVAAIVPPPARPPSIEPEPVAGRTLSGSPGEPDPPSPTGFDEARPTNLESPSDVPLTSVGPLVVEPLEDLDPLGLNGIEIHMLTVEALSLEPLSLQ